MHKILEKFKAFNKKHRKLLPFIVYLEIVVIVILSILAYLRRHLKAVISVLLAICLIVIAVKFATGSRLQQENVPDDSGKIVDTITAENSFDKEEINEDAQAAEGEMDEAALKDADDEKSDEAEGAEKTDNSEEVKKKRMLS